MHSKMIIKSIHDDDHDHSPSEHNLCFTVKKDPHFFIIDPDIRLLRAKYVSYPPNVTATSLQFSSAEQSPEKKLNLFVGLYGQICG